MRLRSKRTCLCWLLLMMNCCVLFLLLEYIYFVMTAEDFTAVTYKNRRPFHSHKLFQPNLGYFIRANLTRTNEKEWRYLILSFESEVRVLWNGTKPVLADPYTQS